MPGLGTERTASGFVAAGPVAAGGRFDSGARAEPGGSKFALRRSTGRRTRSRRSLRSRGRTPLHSAPRHRKFKSVAFRVVLAGLVLVALGGVYAGVQLTRSVAPPTLRPVAGLPPALTVPGRIPALPWPPEGESAVAVAGFGMLGSAGPSRPVPLASLAKVMAAVVVLHDHPLAAGAARPHRPHHIRRSGHLCGGIHRWRLGRPGDGGRTSQ